MDLSQIKLIVTDMDGTLLNSKSEVSAEFPELLKKIHSRGIKFAVASGRQYFSLSKKLNEMKEELIFIAENGAIVMEGEEQKFIQPMNPKMAFQVINLVREIGGKHLILCGKNSAYIEDTSPEFMKPFLQHYDKYEVVDDLTQVKDDVILKLTICDLSGAEESTFPKVKKFKNELQVKLSGEIWIDFTHKDAHKGNALLEIQKMYGISAKESMAFGDFLNDLELFDHAKYSFAMANAHKEVKEKAAFLTESNDDLGVETVLKKLLEQQEIPEASRNNS
ncbi:MAG TPA: HAD family hydrolase [Salinimicrobium sp.]|nr:HAD family hydrolase [Salinimicrobium sp.]